jgi:hypothetical protein
MSDRQVNEITKVFLKAKERLATEDKHCTNTFLNHGSMCLYAALFFSDDDIKSGDFKSLYYPSETQPAVLGIMIQAMKETEPRFNPKLSNDTEVCMFNNAFGFEGVSKALDRAITLSMQT